MLLTPIISTIIGKIIQSISENLEISNFSILFSIVYLSLLILVSGFTVKLMRRKNDYEELEIFPGQLKKFIKDAKVHNILTISALLECLHKIIDRLQFFPKNINIAYLTRSHLILEYFYLFILLSIFSLVLAICILNRRNKALDLSKYKSSFLKYNNQKRKSPFIVILSIIISYIVLWGMALWDENFSNLFLFGFIFSNSLFFIKFIEFQPSLNGKNYYIGEN
ncbi:hypothetical protein ACXZ8Y_07485 [Streptococcus agalactiae]|uniref:Tandem five-TM protein n=2 Tax=Streptococcus agalactiae TaxID=1311 RepID=A0AAD2WUX6_STRAG|nr:hypothetical protein SAG0161_02790 [Streptococcus agalactiae MRI Z1-213]EPU34570.1 hypothetical protein SAG0162_01115 [Streptococcus agalactiae MRI Z1-214]EPU38652.1 hypothetical protein SAG0164_02705 [Streptococcus agalactiae MRI Z1-216]EPX05556.1 hypothetical protein SAG0165_01540 [Streptococcus agalactiae MRI Z1-217]KLL31104.1 hypothetical protein WA00_03970 [Streptococcus agalactiae]